MPDQGRMDLGDERDGWEEGDSLEPCLRGVVLRLLLDQPQPFFDPLPVIPASERARERGDVGSTGGVVLGVKRLVERRAEVVVDVEPLRLLVRLGLEHVAQIHNLHAQHLRCPLLGLVVDPAGVLHTPAAKPPLEVQLLVFKDLLDLESLRKGGLLQQLDGLSRLRAHDVRAQLDLHVPSHFSHFLREPFADQTRHAALDLPALALDQIVFSVFPRVPTARQRAVFLLLRMRAVSYTHLTLPTICSV
eukprot:596477-Rhodomonas_salina.2